MLKKLLSLTLSLVMIMAITVAPAYAASAADDAPVPAIAAGTNDSVSEPDEWILPDWAGDLEKKVEPYAGSFLYWSSDLSLDQKPEVVYDTGLGQVFLAFKLDVPGKIAMLVHRYYDAFYLQRELNSLLDADDMESVVWQTRLWPEYPMARYLSEELVAELKSGNYGVEEALQKIKESDEYKNAPSDLPNLRSQVDFYIDWRSSCADRVMRGLLTFGFIGDDLQQLTPSEMLETAQAFLGENPQLAVLSKTTETISSGFTSKTLATLHALDTAELEELWAELSTMAEKYWPYGIKAVENYRIVIPIAGAEYHGPVDLPASDYDPGALPVAAIGN